MSVEYLAGFFDADGCVSTWDNGGREPVWSAQATQTGEEGGDRLAPLHAMVERWGGAIVKRKKERDTHSQCWNWKTTGIEAAIAIQDMYPFLHTKKEKATQALEHFANHPKFGRIMRRIKEPIRMYSS